MGMVGILQVGSKYDIAGVKETLSQLKAKVFMNKGRLGDYIKKLEGMK